MKNKKRFKWSLTKIYLSLLAGFIASFIFIFLTPIISGGTYSYAESIENEYVSLGNSLRISLVKKEFNPENNLMRLDFSLDQTTTTSSLSNVDFDIMSRNVKNKKSHDLELIRLNDRYMILLIKDIPKNYGVLSTTVLPKSVRSNLKEDNDFGGSNAKFYVNQSEKIINKKLKKESEEYYQKEFITFNQLEIEDEIEEKEKEIQSILLLISDVEETIKNLELDIDYQTEDEKFNTKNEMNSLETSIKKYEKDIESLADEITKLEEKLNLLEKKKKDI